MSGYCCKNNETENDKVQNQLDLPLIIELKRNQSATMGNQAESAYDKAIWERQDIEDHPDASDSISL